MSKKIIFSVFLLCTLFSVNAQNWLTDLADAKQIATEKNQPIILVFQGSDWCAPCIKLDKEIWNTQEFIDYSNKNYVMLLADFPKKRKNKLTTIQQEKNNQLAETYNSKGHFPFVVVLDKSGTILGKTGYKKTSVKAYIELLNSF